MEIGILYIFVLGAIVAPIMGLVYKTKTWKDFENKFFLDHNHYM